jgi:DNA polymerase III epsilon subunit-like protein
MPDLSQIADRSYNRWDVNYAARSRNQSLPDGANQLRAHRALCDARATAHVLDVTMQQQRVQRGIGDCGLSRPPAAGGDLTRCAWEHAACRNLCRKLFDRLALLHGGFSDQRKGGRFGKRMRMHHLENGGKYDTT